MGTTWNNPKTTINKQTKQSFIYSERISLIKFKWHWIACSQFLFKIKLSFDSKERNGKELIKNSASKKILPLQKLKLKPKLSFTAFVFFVLLTLKRYKQ